MLKAPREMLWPQMFAEHYGLCDYARLPGSLLQGSESLSEAIKPCASRKMTEKPNGCRESEVHSEPEELDLQKSGHPVPGANKYL